jgi:hypothetical protein
MKYRDPSERLTKGADNIRNENRVIPDYKLKNGSLYHKFPVHLSDGKTVIYIKDKRKESEVRERWEAIINKTVI